MCFLPKLSARYSKTCQSTHRYINSEISDMIKFCGVPGKILSKSQQFFYSYNEISNNECMDKQTDF